MYAEPLPVVEPRSHSVRSQLEIPSNAAVTCCVSLILTYIVCAVEGIRKSSGLCADLKASAFAIFGT